MHVPGRIRLGTRSSALALAQTRQIGDRLRALGLTVAIETITTRGDAEPQDPIFALGGDGVFVREIERALLDGRIDAAVHSLKDLPTEETPGLVVACVPERASPFDALVGRTAATLAGLPAGAVVGTSSIRRVVQLRALRPDLVIRPIRGNVDTRLRRLDAGDYDALVLAGAGLERLGLGGRITEVLRPESFWPAVSQGALGLQARADDRHTLAAVAALDHAPSHVAVRAERACLAALAGGCLAPIGAWGRVADGTLELGACVLEEVAGVVRRVVAEGGTPIIVGSEVSFREGAETLGASLAADLLARGADAMLQRMRVFAQRQAP